MSDNSDISCGSSSDFILGCAAAAACCDGPIGGNTPAERRRWRFAMGVWMLVFLVFYAVLDWIFGL